MSFTVLGSWIMDSRAIDEAMKRRLPVKYDGKRYDRIMEYVMYYDNDRRRHLSLVLLQGNASFRVPAEKVELAEEQR